MRLGVVGLQDDGLHAHRLGLLEALHHGQGVGQVAERVRLGRLHLEGPFQVDDALIHLAALEAQGADVGQGVGVVGVLLQHQPVEALGLGELPGAVGLHRLFQQFAHAQLAVFHVRIDRRLGDLHRHRIGRRPLVAHGPPLDSALGAFTGAGQGVASGWAAL